MQGPSWLLDILSKCSEPDIILRVLTCLVNIHSVIMKNRPGDQLTELQTSHDELPNTYCLDGKYLQRLREKLSGLYEHSDVDVKDAALRLVHLCL